MEAEDFVWAKAGDGYTISPDQRTVTFQGDLMKQNRTVVGSKGFSSGKHYWRIHIACDNIKVGIATGKASTESELGTDDNSWACNFQTGDVLHNCKTPADPTQGGLLVRLYKLLVPISGGIVGVLLDMEEGKVSLFFNDEYQGVMVNDPDLKSKGPIYPAVAIAGLEGKNCIIQTDHAKVPKTYTYKRNKM